jgi:hypothetical protein
MTDVRIETARDIAEAEIQTLYDRLARLAHTDPPSSISAILVGVEALWTRVYASDLPACTIEMLDEELERHRNEMQTRTMRARVRHIGRRSLRALGGSGTDAR